eukprot:GEMP01036756.1.p1 GENE.GEMP01036756.1~~GEMP01036756.1.p1  ORF type:complete len:376 (+),score=54.42 GEMP01036756.1:251-1378(+)
MSPTLQLIYPVTLPRVYGEEIKYEDLIAVEPLENHLRNMSARRLEFIAQLNNSEISAPNLQNIAQSGLTYLSFIHSLVEASGTMAAHTPVFSWRSGVNNAALPVSQVCDSLKEALTYEMSMVMSTVAASLTAYSSFLLDFDEENVVDSSSLALVTKALAEAGGIYAYAHEHVSTRVCNILRTPADLPELQPKVAKGLSTYCCLCLQQVAYESARTSASNPLLAKICKQVVDYASQIKSNIPSQYGFSGILSHLTPTVHLYSAMAYGHLAKHEWTQENWGVACAYGKLVKNSLAQLRESESKLSSPVLRSVIDREAGSLAKEIAEFENDNTNVYFQREPAAADLPILRGVAVKAPTKYVPDCQPEMVAMLAQLSYT